MATKKQDEENVAESATVTLATTWGRTFQPHGKGLPVITPEGVDVAVESAETIMEQARKHGVTIIKKED